jgi:cysteinyl-tRNA synthetase
MSQIHKYSRLAFILGLFILSNLIISCQNGEGVGVGDAVDDRRETQLPPPENIRETIPATPETSDTPGLGTKRGAQISPLKISEVKSWAVQLQDVDVSDSAAVLAASPYDLIVIEPTRTVKGEGESFDTESLVSHIKASFAHDRLHRKLVIAYVNIGQAEDYRWYWTWPEEWDCKSPLPSSWPKYIVSCDPDGWMGNYPVAYWDEGWKNIIIYGFLLSSNPRQEIMSSIVEVLDDGFDGVYMDWVAGFEDGSISSAARKAGIDPAKEMARFLQEIRTYTQRRNPSFLLIQQNGAALAEEYPVSMQAIDAIAQECTWFCGEAVDFWGDPQGYDISTAQEDTHETITLLERYQSAGLPVFSIDYALAYAQDAYEKATKQGYIPYVSQTSLSRLTTTPPIHFIQP